MLHPPCLLHNSNSGGGRNSVVVSKLSKGKEVSPIILLIIAVGSKVLFQNGIDSFSLAICLWVKGSAEVLGDMKGLGKGFDKVRSKQRISV